MRVIKIRYTVRMPYLEYIDDRNLIENYFIIPPVNTAKVLQLSARLHHAHLKNRRLFPTSNQYHAYVWFAAYKCTTFPYN